MSERTNLAALAMVSMLAACAANLNGRTIGFGSSTPAGPRPSGGAGTSAGGGTSAGEGASAGGSASADGTAVASTSTSSERLATGIGPSASAPDLPPSSVCRPQKWADAWPYLDRPADPWLAVVDGHPARVVVVTRQSGMPPEPSAVCDAEHDHCLRDCTWLVTQPNGSAHPIARAFHVGPDGAFVDAMEGTHRPQPGFVAYRTVPVARTNLRVGMLVMALEAPAKDGGRFESSRWALRASWNVGTVESIDWGVGTLRLEGRREPYFLSAARLAVLRSADGGAVEAIAGVDPRPPSVEPVSAPGHRAAVRDPWAAVGRDGQPVASTDTTAMTGFHEDCRDHCLRPWVWFVDAPRDPLPARWDGRRFVHADQADAPIERPGVAYRTHAATASDLTSDLRVLVYDGSMPPSSEVDAHRLHWSFVVVRSVDRDRGTFTDRDDQRHPIAQARVLVLYWFAGDTAATVE